MTKYRVVIHYAAPDIRTRIIDCKSLERAQKVLHDLTQHPNLAPYWEGHTIAIESREVTPWKAL